MAPLLRSCRAAVYYWTEEPSTATKSVEVEAGVIGDTDAEGLRSNAEYRSLRLAGKRTLSLLFLSKALSSF